MSLYQRVYRVLALCASAVAVVMAARTAESTWLLLFLTLLPARKKRKRVTAMAAQKLLNINEVAERFGVHPSTIRGWLRTGVLKSIRMTPRGFHHFDPAHVEEVIQQRMGSDEQTGQSEQAGQSRKDTAA
jgi:transposase-like protein